MKTLETYLYFLPNLGTIVLDHDLYHRLSDIKVG